MQTGFFWDEKCFWHSGANYAFTLPVGGHVQPLAAGGLPEDPETKRRLKNLMDVTGLSKDLACQSATPATWQELRQIHPESYLERFKTLSDDKGGEMGFHAPFGTGSFEIAAQSVGLVQGALNSVLRGETKNAYALSRPPGHHCLPDGANGFCLLANIALAIKTAQKAGLAQKIAVVDWDVHHGNGTETIFYDRNDVLTISLHQEWNYPMDSGAAQDRGRGTGLGFNMNIPLPPGAGHATYLDVIDRLVTPALRRFQPDVIIVACGFDASLIDPLARMMCTAETFRAMTQQLMATAETLCGGRLVMAHEGGYSEVYVPFCGHAVLQQLSGSAIAAPDPYAEIFARRQPGPAAQRFYDGLVDDFVEFYELA